MSGIQLLSYPYFSSTNLSKLLAGHYGLLLERFSQQPRSQTPSSLNSNHFLSPWIAPVPLLSLFYSLSLIFIAFCSLFFLLSPLHVKDETESLQPDQDSNTNWSNLMRQYWLVNTLLNTHVTLTHFHTTCSQKHIQAYLGVLPALLDAVIKHV